jgi:hypothetical protein
MARRALLSIIVGAILALFSACSDSTGPSLPGNTIRGRVLDADGQPVWGAAIVLQHGLVPVPGGSADKMEIVWNFDVLRAGPVHAGIYSVCGGDEIRTLADEAMPAGVHMLVWDGLDNLGRLVPAGVYRIGIETLNVITIRPFSLMRSGYDASLTPFDVAASATTDGAGDFSLDTYCLAFGYEFPTFDSQGAPIGNQLVTPRVRVWALCEGYPPVAADWVKVDARRGAFVTIRLPRRPAGR